MAQNKKSTKRIEKKKTRKQQRANLSQSGYSDRQVQGLKGQALEKEVKKVDTQKRYNRRPS